VQILLQTHSGRFLLFKTQTLPGGQVTFLQA